jgi:hypothetical protein
MIVSGPRWRAFALVNVNEDVQLLHFVEEGEDSYFVTGYNWDGTEFAGYNMIVGRFPRFRSNVSPYLDVRQVIIYFRLIFCFLDCDLFIKWFIFWINDYNLYGIYHLLGNMWCDYLHSIRFAIVVFIHIYTQLTWIHSSCFLFIILLFGCISFFCF